MAKFITRRKWGRFANEGEIRDIVERVMGPHLKRAGLAIVKAEMQATPVVTGHLRRGWNVGEPTWKGNILRVPVGNAVIYARRVNATSRNNAGYVERGIADGRNVAMDALRAGVKALAAELWEKTQ